jgi:two-component system OmpR family response regulator
MRILIVEDDAPLRNLLLRGLAEDGHVVDALPDGRECRSYLSAAPYDALVLDLNLPYEDGLSILRRLRLEGITTPTLVLTARDAPEDVIAGLDAGADDYLRKPFNFGELEARLRSIIRRPPTYTDTTLRVGDIEYDSSSRSARRGGRELGLTAKESAFLEILMRNPGQIITRRALEDRLWDRESDRISNVLDVYARRLRLKLSENGEPAALQTIRGIGYRLDIQP